MKATKTADYGKNRPNLKQLVELIAYIVKRFDPNGVDLRFMHSKDKLDNRKDTSKIVQSIIGNPFKGMTNLSHCLEKLLQDYVDKIDNWLNGRSDPRRLFRAAERPRPISFYFFTNGVWLGGDHFGQDAIVRLVEKLQSAKMGRSQVGIQFISFGEDSDGLRRLAELDQLNRIYDLKLLVFLLHKTRSLAGTLLMPRDSTATSGRCSLVPLTPDLTTMPESARPQRPLQWPVLDAADLPLSLNRCLKIG